MRFLPTGAWVRASVLAVALLTAGALAGRVDLVVLAAPLVVWVAWALLTRPRTGLSATTSPARRVIATEGATIPLQVGIDGERAPLLLTVAWPDLGRASFDPPYGCRTTLAAEGETCDVQVDPRTWGRVAIGPAMVVATDTAGAWRASRTSETVRATLRPKAASLVGPTGVARPIGTAGQHLSNRRGEGSDLADVRPFVPGDRLRRINWRVTSRTGTLHTNATLTERDTDVLVVADTVHDVLGPDLAGESPLDDVARACVAVSRYYVGLGDRVALADMGSRARNVPAGTGVRQAQRIVDVLSLVRRGPEPGELVRVVARPTPGTLVFVCSPLIEEGALDEVVRLRRLGGEVVVVDCLPAAMGADALDHAQDRSSAAEAWHLRWQEREAIVARLRQLGVPVAAWRGPTSLGSVLLAMEAARTAPRLGVGR